ncbi:MAG: hypothetical protein U9N83_13980 [Thermodesulfobacteriota bacterium]|nr:hypothetical protein [Thermodesulfobacteriota bacterium]
MKKIPIILLLSIFAFTLFAEEDPVSKKKPRRKDALNVYMDASNYLKKEVPFINYVRDVQDADLVVLVTFQSTGSGGGEYTFFVDGQKKFAGIKDTVKFHTYPDDTDEQVMRKGATVFKMGLMRYILETPMAEFIDIQFTEPIEEEVSTDKWNNWVFTTSLSGSLQGQQSADARAFNTVFNANRTTQKLRLSTGIIFNTSKTEYDYGDFTATDKRENSRIYGDIVKSLGEHWALGASSDVFKSIYSNYDIGFTVGPAIEYDIFPYSESTRRIFRFTYIMNYGFSNYTDTTVFLKTEESLWSHWLETSYTNFQQWGTLNFTAGWSNYLHDFSLNRLTIGAYASVKIAKGLTFNMQAGYQFIHDQVSLRKGDASIEDILLNRKELSTTYGYQTSVGITYRFGSIYNNVVNPRLDVLF